MKKLYFSIVFALLALVGNAQTNPNRVLVREASGNLKGFLAERVDSIYFGKVDGRVAADVTFTSFEKTDAGATINLKVVKTAACQSFSIAVLPTNRASMLSSDAQKANYIENYGSDKMYDDFSKGAQMTIPSADQTFTDNTSYTIMTVGYDEYGIACGVSEAQFTTPKPQIVGNPSVSWEVSDVTTTSFKIKFTPNADCYGYHICSFDMAGGGILGYYNSMAPMFGFSSVGQMIAGWSGGERGEAETVEFKNMEPGSEYEIGVQPLDINGNFPDYLSFKVKTLGAGGTGVATVSVEVPASDFYKSYDNNSKQWVYGQRVIFTPNDQTNIYRDFLVEASYYDKDPESYNKDYLFPDQITANTNRTGVDNDVWTVKPSTKYYAIAVAQNNNEEWGDIVKFEFTTPDASKAQELQSSAKGMKASTVVPARIAVNGKAASVGAVAPKSFYKNGIRLEVVK